LRRLLGSKPSRSICGHDDVHRDADDLGGEFRKALSLAAAPPPFNDDVLPFDVAEITQPLSERVGAGGGLWRGSRDERDPRDPSGRLRLGGERRGKKTP
jgi:hypothetical protein